jgi:hydrogenase nickel incorporation protein HypB
MHAPTDEHLLEKLLQDNEQLARHNKDHFDEDRTLVVNFMSAPGAGKTSFIEAAVKHLKDDLNLAVIEGDMVGELDCDRLREANIPAFQISTGRACHLDAAMVSRLIHEDKFPDTDVLFIENVGNLVCPAEFPLGEHLRVVCLSVTEGDDKPFKYPVIFHNCDAVIFTKCDLLAYVNFDMDRARSFVHNLNPSAQIFVVSAKTDLGVADWVFWLKHKKEEHDKQLREQSHVHSHTR